MKRLILLFVLLTGSAFSQGIEGDWYGDIDISAMKLSFILHISSENDSYKSSLDIPMQKALGIPMTNTSFTENEIIITSKELGGEFKGQLKDEIFTGTFSQNGGVYPFSMSKVMKVEKQQLRPQEPKPKFSYKIQEVAFKNDIDKVKLAGTLTLPTGRGPFPAVVLVSGSGPQDRNSEILGHKSFWVIADYLTKNGIAVLRYDDRGVGGSDGDFNQGTTDNFARDASAAVNFLRTNKKIDQSKIGIIGHSEGGTIAPIVASNPLIKVDFIIMLAGTAIPGAEILMKQQELIAAISGAPEEEIVSNSQMSLAIFQFLRENIESKTLKSDMSLFLETYLIENETNLPEGFTIKKMAEFVTSSYTTPWMMNFLFFDPQYALLNTKCPILALNGSNDLQVVAEDNLKMIEKLAQQSGNENVTTIKLDGLNHLFQHSDTGSPEEYGQIEETFAPEVLSMMKNFVKELPKVLKK